MLENNMPRHPNLLNREQSALLVIDIQEKLARVMPDRNIIIDNATKLIKGCNHLKIPVFYTEQYPKGLGETVPELKTILTDQAIEKTRFSTCCNSDLMKQLEKFELEQIIISGMEAHVCVLQTAFDLSHAGFQIHIATDAVCSRKTNDKEIALKRMQQLGITLTTTEAALFELLETSENENFKKISNLVK